ncbi:hypothetical protein EV368DRAFT_80353 [Lentinula lateritia]|nr:hypothetical protein EV368DRAFT_80353 [Lentinula lateritia]
MSHLVIVSYAAPILLVEGVVRVWAYEAFELYQDPLVSEEKHAWTDENMDVVALEYFLTISKAEALCRPISFSNWTSKDYIPVNREILHDYTKACLKVFYEEELDIPLVLFNGSSEVDRLTSCSINGLSIFHINVSNKYTGDDFDEELGGSKEEKICFIMDESNIPDSYFLERMNMLLANAEVPGLFEGNYNAALMTACKEGSQRDSLMLYSPKESYW